MTELRDARLQKALQEAPDADARPAPQVAHAIRAAARNALPAVVPKGTPSGWWQRLWQSTANPRAPWSAAFATLLVAVLVTVMWVREPIPDARPIAPSAPTVPAATPTPEPIMPMPAAKDTSASRGMATGPEPSARPAAKSVPAAQTRPAAASVPDAPVAPAATGIAGAAAAPPAAKAEQAPATTERLAQSAAPIPASAPAPAQEQTQSFSKASSAGAVADAHSRTARLQKDAAADVMAQPSVDLSGLNAWTALRVQMDGRSTTLDRVQGQRLFTRMIRLVRQMPAATLAPAAVPASEPTLRLTVLSQGQTLAVMSLWDGTVLWQRPAQTDVITSISTADLQALLQLANQAQATGVPD